MKTKNINWKNFFFSPLAGFHLSIWFIVSLLLFAGCIQDKDTKMVPEITPGNYERSAIIDDSIFDFHFNFGNSKNFNYSVFAGSEIIKTGKGFWEQTDNLLCIYSTDFSGCEEIRNINSFTFEMWDTDSKTWIIWRRTS